MDRLHTLTPGSGPARQQGCVCDPQQSTTVDGPNNEPLACWRCEPMRPIHGLGVAHALLHADGRSHG